MTTKAGEPDRVSGGHSIESTLRDAIRHLSGVTGSPRLDAQLLLAHVLDVPRETLIAHSERVISDVAFRTFQSLITLRRDGMPVAYLLGSRPFYDRLFRVSPHVLIPRPETEILVDLALKWSRAHARQNLRLIDVGTGSGVIGVMLAAKLPEAFVIAADVSGAALSIAQENGADLPNLAFVQADLLTSFGGRFDLIASNLPYIASAELNILEVARFEPGVALDGGADGLDLIRALLDQVPRRLATPGLLLLEHGADQGAAVAGLARAAFPLADVQNIRDDAGLDRVVRVETGAW